MKICVIGTGYVGLVAGVCFADAGHQVTCVDKDPTKINLLKDKKIPIYEPGLEELLEQAVQKKKIEFTTDLATAVQNNEVVFIAVGTPFSLYSFDAAKSIVPPAKTFSALMAPFS